MKKILENKTIIYALFLFFTLINFSHASLVNGFTYIEKFPNKKVAKVTLKNTNNHNHNEKATLGSTKKENITIKNAYIRTTIGKSNNSSAYMEIISSSEDYLLKATIQKAKKVEIHSAYIDSKKVMSMKNIKKIKITKNNSLILKPSGYHLMIIGLSSQINEGDKIRINLYFQNAGIVKLTLPAKSIMKNKHKHNH